MAKRFSRLGLPYAGLTNQAGWTGNARFAASQLEVPLRWRSPARVFVNSMGDPFHSDITNEEIAAIFAVMAVCPHLTFQVLTKRPQRMREWFDWATSGPTTTALRLERCWFDITRSTRSKVAPRVWPLPNVELYVTAEDQKRANERIPILLDTPAAFHGVSLEPMLEDIDLEPYLDHIRQDSCVHCGDDARDFLLSGELRWTSRGDALCRECGNEREADGSGASLDLVIAGGESGPGARACNLSWLRNIVHDCEDNDVLCFIKQAGANAVDSLHVDDDEPPLPVTFKDRKGADPSEWESYLQVRQLPEVPHVQ
jgi:protein gp37